MLARLFRFIRFAAILSWMFFSAWGIYSLSEAAVPEVANPNSDSSTALNAGFIGLVTLSAFSMGLTQVAGPDNRKAQMFAMVACALFFFSGIPLLHVYACKHYVVTKPPDPGNGFERWNIIHEHEIWNPIYSAFSVGLYFAAQLMATVAMMSLCIAFVFIFRGPGQPRCDSENKEGDRAGAGQLPGGITEKP
jgi:hypothetical protein